MIAESQIREKLVRFLSKEISLNQFEDWLVQSSWNMHKDSDESAQKLASAIELRLAEYSSGHLDERELRDELRPLVISYTMQISFDNAPLVPQEPPNNATVDAHNKVINFPARWGSPSPAASVRVDRERAAELA